MKPLPTFLLLLLTLQPARAAETQPAPPLIPAKDTTLITSPLNPDGTPDYLAYLNNELSKNITPQNNAAIPLLKAFGPNAIFNDKLRPLALKALNLQLPADGPYFIQLYAFAKKNQNDLPEAMAEKPFDMSPLFNAQDLAEKTPWTPKEYPLLAKWLTANEDPLKQITAATNLPRLYIPFFSTNSPPSFNDSTLLFPIGHIREAANALCARAMLHLAANDIPAAHADILTVHRLARLQSQQPFLIHNLVAVAIDKLASNAELTILRSPNLTADQARQIFVDLSALPELNPNNPAVDQAEHFFLLNLLMPATQGNPTIVLNAFTLYDDGPIMFKVPPTPPNDLNQVDWNIALRAINRRVDLGEAALNHLLPKDREQALEPLRQEQNAAHLPVPPFDLYSAITTMPSPEDRERQSKMYLKNLSEFLSRHPNESIPDFSSRIALFFTPVSPRGEKFLILINRNLATHRLTLLAAALALHHFNHQSYPATLDDLAPYFPAKKIPLDPFTAKPFLYHPTEKGYLLYSTGDNALDDHAHDAAPKSDDIIIRIP